MYPIIVTSSIIWLLNLWLGPIELEDEEDEEDEAGERGDEEEDEDSIFIPLGIWPTQKPREFYKGSDPEWKEFAKFSKDNDGHTRARDKLVSTLRNNVAGDKRFAQILGKVDISKGNQWLDIIFPEGPPLEYERSGLEITDEHLAWTTRTVTSRNYQRFQKAIWPEAAFWATFATMKEIAQTHYRQARQVFGIDDEGNEGHPAPADAKKKPATPAADASSNSKRTQSKLPPSGSKSASATSTTEQNAGWIDISPPSANSAALQTFMHNFTKQYRGFKMEPPRGSVVLKGMISVVGDKGRMTFNVIAFYDPKTEQYVGMGAQVNSFSRKVQRPRGGN